jgi:hypothetical protein
VIQLEEILNLFVHVAVVLAVSGKPWLGGWSSRADLWSSLAFGLPQIIPQVLARSATTAKPGCRQVWFRSIMFLSRPVHVFEEIL